MTVRQASAVLVLATLAGCSHAPAPLPPAPSGVQRLAVERPANRTEDDLIVYGPGILQRILKDDIVTVPDLLAEDLRRVLTRQGFRVAAPGTEDVPVLRTEIGRWEHYAASYNTVTVDVVASLFDPASGRELWRAARSGWVLPTYDAESRRDACLSASTAIAEALLEGWEPAGAPAR